MSCTFTTLDSAFAFVRHLWRRIMAISESEYWSWRKTQSSDFFSPQHSDFKLRIMTFSSRYRRKICFFENLKSEFRGNKSEIFFLMSWSQISKQWPCSFSKSTDQFILLAQAILLKAIKTKDDNAKMFFLGVNSKGRHNSLRKSFRFLILVYVYETAVMAGIRVLILLLVWLPLKHHVPCFLYSFETQHFLRMNWNYSIFSLTSVWSF